MPTKDSKGNGPFIREKADGSGPSGHREKKNAAARAVSRVYQSLTALVLGLTSLVHILGNLNMNINVAMIPPDDENAPEVWRKNREVFKETIMEVYDASDMALGMAIRTEKHMATGQYEVLMGGVQHVRETVFQLLPQDLYDCLVGKGKGVAGH